MLVFERGERRMHVSYHSDGRIHYKTDRPNAASVLIESDFPTGRMQPLCSSSVRPTDVVARQEVGITGLGMTDVETAGLNQFVPGERDVLINQPDAMSLGFCVNVVGRESSPRAFRGGDRILERRYVEGLVKLEIEVFDWLVEP